MTSTLTTKTTIITMGANAVFATVNITDLVSDWIGIVGGSMSIIAIVFVTLKNYEHWRDARQKRLNDE